MSRVWPRLVMTAFGPFGGESVNASERLLQDLAARFPRALTPWRERVHLERLMCPEGEGALSRLDAQVEALLARHGEALYLLTGQAAGRNHLAFERHALNLYQGRPIDPRGPAAYAADLPDWLDFPAWLRRAGLPAWSSRDPGEGACNHLHYRLCRLAEEGGVAIRAGFLHLPITPAQVVQHHPRSPAWPTTMTRSAVVALLRRLVDHLPPVAEDDSLPRPRIGAVDQVVLPVRDVEHSARFYARVLGMEVQHRGRSAALRFAGREIVLRPHEGGGAPAVRELRLLCEQPLARFLAHLLNEGVAVEEGPVQRPGAAGPVTVVYFRDPDGHRLGVAASAGEGVRG